LDLAFHLGVSIVTGRDAGGVYVLNWCRNIYLSGKGFNISTIPAFRHLRAFLDPELSESSYPLEPDANRGYYSGYHNNSFCYLIWATMTGRLS
jgi:hypothetical protein